MLRVVIVNIYEKKRRPFGESGERANTTRHGSVRTSPRVEVPGLSGERAHVSPPTRAPTPTIPPDASISPWEALGSFETVRIALLSGTATPVAAVLGDLYLFIRHAMGAAQPQFLAARAILEDEVQDITSPEASLGSSEPAQG